MRRAHNLDKNHKEIVGEFERLGCVVQSLAGIGRGCPDLLVGMPVCGQGTHGLICNVLVEVKDEHGVLTKDEIIWRNRWPTVVHVVRTREDVQALLQ